MATRTYDPKNVVLSFAGTPIQGYGPDTFIEAERDADGYTDVAGTSGEVARAKSNDHRGSIKLTLLMTSPYVDKLSTLALADEQTGSGVAPVELKELNGTTLVSGTDGWIKKFPAVKRAKEVETVEFEIRVGEMKVFVGGMLS
jgi:hypothetical protein